MKQIDQFYTGRFWCIGNAVAVFANSIVLGAITEVPGDLAQAVKLGYLDSGLPRASAAPSFPSSAASTT
jgi:hypothetical protein